MTRQGKSRRPSFGGGHGFKEEEKEEKTKEKKVGELRGACCVVCLEWEANEFLPVCYTTTGATTREEGGCDTFLVTFKSTSEQVKMVMTSSNPRGTTPVTTGTTPVTTGGRSSARSRSLDAVMKETANMPRSVKFDRVGDQVHGSGGSCDGSCDGVIMMGPRPMLDVEEIDEITVYVGESGAPCPIARQLESKVGEVAPAIALAPDERSTTGSRLLMNRNAPNAYKILEQVGLSMVATSTWMMMFGTKRIGGAKWVTLEKELASPIYSSGLTQLAEQTKRLLEVMGIEYTDIPSKVSLQVWDVGDVSAELAKWKRKLKYSFGIQSSTTVQKLNGIDPSTVPVPSTPKKTLTWPGFQTTSTKRELFSKFAESPYSMGPHMRFDNIADVEVDINEIMTAERRHREQRNYVQMLGSTNARRRYFRSTHHGLHSGRNNRIRTCNAKIAEIPEERLMITQHSEDVHDDYGRTINQSRVSCKSDSASDGLPAQSVNYLNGSNEPVGECTHMNANGLVVDCTHMNANGWVGELRPPIMLKPIRLHDGERRGWWSAKQFDRRTRMRAIVMGAVNDRRAKLLLDTGASVSVISKSLAEKLKLITSVSAGRRIGVQDITEDKVSSCEWDTGKLTLGSELTYELIIWVVPQCAGVDVILVTDFMIPAGVRLDLLRSTMLNPDEVVIPLLNSLSETNDQSSAKHEPGGPRKPLEVPPSAGVQFTVRKSCPNSTTHALWTRRTKRLVPTVELSKFGKPLRVKVTNITDRRAWRPSNFTFVWWVPRGELPVDDGFVQLHTRMSAIDLAINSATPLSPHDIIPTTTLSGAVTKQLAERQQLSFDGADCKSTAEVTRQSNANRTKTRTPCERRSRGGDTAEPKSFQLSRVLTDQVPIGLPGYKGYELSFSGSANLDNFAEQGSCSWILWSLPTLQFSNPLGRQYVGNNGSASQARARRTTYLGDHTWGTTNNVFGTNGQTNTQPKKGKVVGDLPSPLRPSDADLMDAAARRREANRLDVVVLAMAKPHQVSENARRAKEQIETLWRRERLAVSVGDWGDRGGADGDDTVEEPRQPSRFEYIGRVKLFLERVKPDLINLLAYRWHWRYRIEQDVMNFVNKIDRSIRQSRSSFYPVVSVSSPRR
ncbi:unnamed protein product [Phytophthora fragariaefolia]|uniref:Unnamed protein product n=1 Tax=Phytophthora fragariaefolia TaxID=1490495 RepID=A0A9W7D3M1_9STRA|nr:unnamed protein product [Phytophthora fragariaefolia]